MSTGNLPTIVWLFSGLLATAARAQSPVRDHQITPDDYFTLAVVGTCVMAPSGEYVAYTETRWEPPRDKRNTDLWLVETSGRQVRRLTFDPAADRSQVWSPDSRHLYFLSSRQRAGETEPPHNGKTQVWRVASAGGPPIAVTREPEGVGLFDLSADGRMLYYTIPKEDVEERWKEMRNEFKELEYGHGIREFSQVVKLDLQHWRTETIVDEGRVIGDLAVSPDQRRIAMITTPDDELIHNEGWSRVDVFDARTRSVITVTAEGWRTGHPSPFGWIDSVAWADDGNALAWTVSFDGYPTRLYVAQWSGDEFTTSEVDRPDGVTVTGGSLRWRPASRDLVFIGEDHARARVYAIPDVRNDRHGPVRTLTPGDVVVSSFDPAAGGKDLAVVLATTRHPRDVFTVSASGQYRRLTTVNPQVDTWKLPRISIVKWKGEGGDTVEGILELPPDHTPRKPLPLIVEIHGGPTAASLYELRFWIYGRTLLPAKGYALLSPNYRGSTGFGDKFMVDLVGRENDIEVTDILTGVDAMIERGIADPDRLGVMGWSNGGFLTNCLISTTDRFKAASSGAGVVDQVIQWGTEDTPGHVVNYMKGLPWLRPDAYRAGSPLYNLHNVKTPTLIHVGAGDQRVPAAHARTLYRALRFYLNVPTELVVYPGAGHGLTTYKHRKAKMKWDLAWFDRYLGPASSPATSDVTAAKKLPD
ncbi:MAG: prolyl oligopeptidase family serine peptidase [Phycisphaerae bacterium]